MSILFRRVAIIGTGLIGSSIAAGLKASGVAEETVGCDRDAGRLEMARRLSFVDRSEPDPGRAVTGAQSVILAVPLDEVFRVMDAIGPDVRPGALITCTAGTTARVQTQMVKHVRSAENFVPAFPLVYSPSRGPGKASPSLLLGQRCIVARSELSSERAVEEAAELWRALGMKVELLPADRFEALVAGHHFWPLALGATVREVASRGGWPRAMSALGRMLEAVQHEEDLDRCMQLYAQRICALLGELIEELSSVQRQLGGEQTQVGAGRESA